MRRRLEVLVSVLLIVGLLAVSRKADADILVRVGGLAGEKLRAELPDAATVAGPLVALRPGDALPIEEQVRVRIRSDKQMIGADVTVLSGPNGGVRLRGLVLSADQAHRAEVLALGTVGVTTVVNDLAVPIP